MTRKSIPPLDLMFFLTESAQSPKHVGAVQVFTLPDNAPDTYLRDLVSAFQQAPVVPPFNYHPYFPRIGMPEWREDEALEMSYHVRHSALPKPGNTAQLMEVVERLHAPLLDRRRPGWLCQVIEGLEGNRFAIYTKIHHAYIDGMSGVKRMYGSLSTDPDSKSIVPTWSFQPESAPAGSSRKAGRAGVSRLTKQVRGLIDAAGFFGTMSLQWLRLQEGKAQIPYSASPTRMNRPVEWETRTTAICTFPLEEVKGIGRQANCTVNEVVLAVIGAALDDYLERHGERHTKPLVALCPMSLRTEGDDTASTQVSAVLVKLGNPGTSIRERLLQVVDSSHDAKDLVSGMSSEGLMDYGVIFFALMELLNRSKLDRYIAPNYNVLVSNVPGPGVEHMYLCGSRLEASYPISTLLPGVNLNATLLSHGNSLDFGLMGDRHSLPDLDVVARCMEQRFEELRTAVLGKKKGAGRAGTGKKAKTKAKPKVQSKARTKTPPKRNTQAKSAAGRGGSGTRSRGSSRARPAARAKAKR